MYCFFKELAALLEVPTLRLVASSRHFLFLLTCTTNHKSRGASSIWPSCPHTPNPIRQLTRYSSYKSSSQLTTEVTLAWWIVHSQHEIHGFPLPSADHCNCQTALIQNRANSTSLLVREIRIQKVCALRYTSVLLKNDVQSTIRSKSYFTCTDKN